MLKANPGFLIDFEAFEMKVSLSYDATSWESLENV
jgi:hypothetical protein